MPHAESVGIPIRSPAKKPLFPTKTPSTEEHENFIAVAKSWCESMRHPDDDESLPIKYYAFFKGNETLAASGPTINEPIMAVSHFHTLNYARAYLIYEVAIQIVDAKPDPKDPKKMIPQRFHARICPLSRKEMKTLQEQNPNQKWWDNRNMMNSAAKKKLYSLRKHITKNLATDSWWEEFAHSEFEPEPPTEQDIVNSVLAQPDKLFMRFEASEFYYDEKDKIEKLRDEYKAVDFRPFLKNEFCSHLIEDPIDREDPADPTSEFGYSSRIDDSDPDDGSWGQSSEEIFNFTE